MITCTEQTMTYVDSYEDDEEIMRRGVMYISKFPPLQSTQVNEISLDLSFNYHLL